MRLPTAFVPSFSSPRLRIFVVSLILLFARTVRAENPILSQLGIEQLSMELGRKTPTGRGIEMGHVEGGGPQQYLPDSKSDQFRNIHFLPRSGPSGVSDHATATAGMIYGRTGLAPGVTDVHCFASSHWLGAGCLRVNDPGSAPVAGGVRVLNHSWIGEPTLAAPVLRRMDYLIDSSDVIVVTGVNNGEGSPLPALLSHAYNAIAVGNYAGQSSGGYTRLEVAGRCKPDLVAPGGKTSFSTPVVAAMVARLLEVADAMDASSNARRPEVIKAVLLSGAEKPEGWRPEPGRPLARHWGAGRVRLDHSYRILTHGPVDPESTTERYGWAFRTVEPNAVADVWRLDSAADLGTSIITITWHRRVDGRTTRNLVTSGSLWLDIPRLADFDLQLVHIDDRGETHVIGTSQSTIDNVEHLHFPTLPAGRYRIEVTRKDELAEAWGYALAWRFERAGR